MSTSDHENDIPSPIEQFVNETFGKPNATAKEPMSIEGMAVAYTSLVLMAIIPIYFGSFRSISFIANQRMLGEKPETITKQDALKFPLVASCVLFGIYLFFKIFSQEYINLLIGLYFFSLGSFAIYHIAGSSIANLIPSVLPNRFYHLQLTESGDSNDDKKEMLSDVKFDRKDCVAFLVCVVICGWYALQKHWIANNIIGLAFATNGVELLQLNSVSTGCILLVGLFFYDVFWVFGTNVMVTVAKNFDAPIKVVFPQDFLVSGIFSKNFSMLGLGDIVIPGIFIALLLRFDVSLKRNTKTYFYSSFLAYFIGLVTTIVIMTVFQHPQPALLYLVPACITVPLGVAFLKGDLKKMFAYTDEQKEETDTETKDESDKKSD